MISLHWWLAIWNWHPCELARRRRLTTKLRISDPPMNLVNLFVAGVNLGISTKSRGRNELRDRLKQRRQYTLDKLQITKLLRTRQLGNQSERPEKRKQCLCTPSRVDALLRCRGLREKEL